MRQLQLARGDAGLTLRVDSFVSKFSGSANGIDRLRSIIFPFISSMRNIVAQRSRVFLTGFSGVDRLGMLAISTDLPITRIGP